MTVTDSRVQFFLLGGETMLDAVKDVVEAMDVETFRKEDLIKLLTIFKGALPGMAGNLYAIETAREKEAGK